MSRQISLTFALCTAFVLAALPLRAEEAERTRSVGLGLSVLGATVEPSLRLSPRLGVRLPIGTASLSRSEEVEGNDIDGTLRLGGVALLGDFYPLKGGLRVSGGVLASNFRLSGSSVGEFELNDEAYTGTFSAYAELPRALAPVVAVGFGSGNTGPGWSISGDLGVVYANGLAGDITATSDNALVAAQFEADLAEARAQLRKDLDDVKLLPYASLSVNFRF